MKLASWGTAGARRRLRWHSRKPGTLRYRGLYRGRGDNPDSLVFEVDADDGRTYRIDMSPDDAAVVVEAEADRRARDRERGPADDRQCEIPLTGAGCNLADTTVATEGTGDD